MRHRVFRLITIVAMVAAASTQASAIFKFQFDEFGNGRYQFAGSDQWIQNSGGLEVDPSGGVVGVPVLVYTLPEVVSSGDVGFYENGTGPDFQNLSDAFRFWYLPASNQSVLIFYSDKVEDAEGYADSGFPDPAGQAPLNIPATSWVEETGKEGGTQWCIWDPQGFPVNNRYEGLSDGVVPEPCTLLALALGSLGLIARRRPRA